MSSTDGLQQIAASHVVTVKSTKLAKENRGTEDLNVHRQHKRMLQSGDVGFKATDDRLCGCVALSCREGMRGHCCLVGLPTPRLDV